MIDMSHHFQFWYQFYQHWFSSLSTKDLLWIFFLFYFHFLSILFALESLCVPSIYRWFGSFLRATLGRNSQACVYVTRMTLKLSFESHSRLTWIRSSSGHPVRQPSMRSGTILIGAHISYLLHCAQQPSLQSWLPQEALWCPHGHF